MAGGKEIVVFTDGSFRGVSAGLGIVVCSAGKVRIRSVSWPGCRNSNEAETMASAEGLEDALENASPGDRVILVVDFKSAARYVNDRTHGPKERSVDEILGPVVDEIRGFGVSLEAVPINGHGRGREDYALRDAHLNGVADCLANLGRFGTEVDRTFADDQRLKASMRSFDHRLDPRASLVRRRSLTKSEAALAIGVSRETVDDLVRHGHLSLMRDYPTLTSSSVRIVADEVRRLRAAAMAEASLRGQQPFHP